MNPIYTDGFLELESLASEILGHSLPRSLSRKSKCMSNAAASSAQADFRVVSAFLLLPSIWSYFCKIGWRAGWISWHFPWEGGQLICLPNVPLHPTTNQLRILAILPTGHNPLGDKVWCRSGFVYCLLKVPQKLPCCQQLIFGLFALAHCSIGSLA